MDKSYLTDYTESIEEVSRSFEFLVANSTVTSKAKSKGFYSMGSGIVSKNFYVGNNLTEGLISIKVENSNACILSIPKNGQYEATISKKVTKKFSPKSGGIILPSQHICYSAITNYVDDLIMIIDMKKLEPIFKKNYNYNFKKIPIGFIRLNLKNKKVFSLINFIKSTLETAKNYPNLRDSLLIKSNIEEISALYITDLIAEALKIPFNLKNASIGLDLVLKAEKLMEENPDKYFTIGQIADQTFTTSRNLQMAFKKHRTYSPLHFLKERKFHRARRLLLNSQPESSIKSIALSVGIMDINRFGARYKELFGELPSETKQKSLRNSARL